MKQKEKHIVHIELLKKYQDQLKKEFRDNISTLVKFRSALQALEQDPTLKESFAEHDNYLKVGYSFKFMSQNSSIFSKSKMSFDKDFEICLSSDSNRSSGVVLIY